MVSSLVQPILRICASALLLVFALFFVTSNCEVFTHCEVGQALLENGFAYSELGDCKFACVCTVKFVKIDSDFSISMSPL